MATQTTQKTGSRLAAEGMFPNVGNMNEAQLTRLLAEVSELQQIKSCPYSGVTFNGSRTARQFVMLAATVTVHKTFVVGVESFMIVRSKMFRSGYTEPSDLYAIFNVRREELVKEREAEEARKRGLITQVDELVTKMRHIVSVENLQMTNFSADSERIAIDLFGQEAYDLYFAKKTAEAEARAAQELKRHQSVIDHNLAAAEEKLSGGDYALAAFHSGMVLTIDANHERALEIKLEAEQRQTEFEAKKKQITENLENGRAELTAGKFDDANLFAEEVLSLDPNNTDAVQLLADIEHSLEAAKREAETTQMLDVAEAALNRSDFESAKAEIQRVLAEDCLNQRAQGLLHRLTEQQALVSSAVESTLRSDEELVDEAPSSDPAPEQTPDADEETVVETPGEPEVTSTATEPESVVEPATEPTTPDQKDPAQE